jgi:hypothetical protein
VLRSWSSTLFFSASSLSHDVVLKPLKLRLVTTFFLQHSSFFLYYYCCNNNFEFLLLILHFGVCVFTIGWAIPATIWSGIRTSSRFSCYGCTSHSCSTSWSFVKMERKVLIKPIPLFSFFLCSYLLIVNVNDTIGFVWENNLTKWFCMCNWKRLFYIYHIWAYFMTLALSFWERAYENNLCHILFKACFSKFLVCLIVCAIGIAYLHHI